MRQQPHDMAHILGGFAKWTAILAVFGFSITLSYTFFASIAPPAAPWFPIAGLSLTEGGVALWFIVFRLQRHDPFQKSIAVLMAGMSAFCCLLIAGYEFYGLMASTYILLTAPWIFQVVSVLLVLVFCAHVTAFVVDMIGTYFQKPGNHFRNNGNLIPAKSLTGQVEVEELMQAINVVTGYLTAVNGGNEADPLAGRQLPRPQEGPNLAILDVAKAISGGVNSLTSRVKDSIKSGKKGGLVPGKTNETTEENTLLDVKGSEGI